MMELISTFGYPEDGDYCRDISGGTGRWPIGRDMSGGTGRTPIDGQRTVITVRRPGSCGTILTV